GGQQRVFGVALEVPAAAWAAVQVDRGAKDYIDSLPPRLRREQRRQPLHQAQVPGGGDRGGRGEVRRRVGVVVHPSAYPYRAVGEHDLAQPDRRLWMQCPPVGAGDQAHLLLQGELREEGFNVSSHSALSLPSRRAGREWVGRGGLRSGSALAGGARQVDVLPQRPEERETELRVVDAQHPLEAPAAVLTVTVLELVPQIL